MSDTRRLNSYKHQWSRYVARERLWRDFEAVKVLLKNQGIELPSEDKLGRDEKGRKEGENTIGQLLRATAPLIGHGFVPPCNNVAEFKVGIVGAGVSGLFTALVFDWLNEQIEGLHVDYDIMEAAGEERVGGRLYTHHFSKEKHDYYDVGAMRFPNNRVMTRTFRLFDYIGLIKEKKLIPYYLDDLNGVCPTYFNDISHVGNFYDTLKLDDPFLLNIGLPHDNQIDAEVLKGNPGEIVSKALKKFTDKAKEEFEKYREFEKKTPEDGEKREDHDLWKLLMEADKMSVRQFLGSVKNPGNIPDGPGYNYNTIEWLETATYGTGWYDQALTECVLEELDFTTTEDKSDKTQYWWCIEGGAQEIAKAMEKKIKKKVQYHHQVEAISCNPERRWAENVEELKKIKDKYVPMSLKVKQTYPDAKATLERSKDYFAVFNTTTLGALQRMNLKDAGLLWGTKQAIRALGYGASCKVGIKFKSAWWQKKPFNITKGGVSRTDLPLRVCVYPSYNIETLEGQDWNPDKPAVLLCSYTWGQDAQRIASLISPDTPEHEGELLKTMLHDLALMHANDTMGYDELLELLYREYDTHHAWDWYQDDNMSGAFAYFGPGQYSNMWEEIIKPNAFGQLYFVGEAASSHHAWVVGALESVIRAVYTMFDGLYQHSKLRPYKEALDKLKKAQRPENEFKKGVIPTGSPFYPLPDEMPQRQFMVDKGTDLTRDPTDASDDTSLEYASAAATLSLIECYVQLVFSRLS